MYRYIINPTNRKFININSTEGVQLLNNYLSYFMTGGSPRTTNVEDIWDSLPWQNRDGQLDSNTGFRLPLSGIINFVNLPYEKKQNFRIIMFMLSNILEPSFMIDMISGLYVNKNNKDEIIYIQDDGENMFFKHDLSFEMNIQKYGEYDTGAAGIQEITIDDYNQLVESGNYQELNSVMNSMKDDEKQMQFIDFIRDHPFSSFDNLNNLFRPRGFRRGLFTQAIDQFRESNQRMRAQQAAAAAEAAAEERSLARIAELQERSGPVRL